MDTKNITKAKKLIKDLEGIVSTQALFRRIADNVTPELRTRTLYVGSITAFNKKEEKIISIPYDTLRQLSSCVANLLDGYKDELFKQIEEL